MEKIQEIVEKKGATFVNAKFKTLGTIPRVLVKIPGKNNVNLKLVPEHKILCWGKEEKELSFVLIPEHIRTGIMIEKKLVFCHFYGIPANGEYLVCDVTVTKKIDFFRNEESFSLSFTKSSEQENPIYSLKIGTPKEFPISFIIPETKKFIGFKEI